MNNQIIFVVLSIAIEIIFIFASTIAYQKTKNSIAKSISKILIGIFSISCFGITILCAYITITLFREGESVDAVKMGITSMVLMCALYILFLRPILKSFKK